MNAKRIGFDARMWDHPGIGRYIRELTEALVRSRPPYEFRFLKSPEVRSGIYSVSEQLEILIRSRGLDLLHVPHFNIPLLYAGRLVVTIHDLTYLHEPRASRFRFGRDYARWMLQAVSRKAAAIITVSQFTKNDFLDCFPKTRAEKVRVIPEAVSPVFRRLEDTAVLKEARGRFKLEKPFVLFVGTLKPHKNIGALIGAIGRLRAARGMDVELILVGRRDEHHADILGAIEENSFVRYLGELRDEELALLYNLAELFVLPSFREGFGLPVLEAMSCGAPVLASNRTSLPEVVGEAGGLFDPQSVDALEESLYNVLKNSDGRLKMREMGLQRVRAFSWDKAAKDTLQVYQQVLV